MDTNMSTSMLLGQYADLVNQYGVHSQESREFLEEHTDDKEFIELAETANFLKSKLEAYQKKNGR